MSRNSRLIVGLALGACYLAMGASQASASHVSCGDVITEDTTLDSNLGCPPSSEGPMLTIAADGVTLDLGGHVVSFFYGLGVLNDGHDGVTIRNGGVGAGPGGVAVTIRHADGNLLKRLSAGGGGGGPAALLDDSDDNRVVRSSFGGDLGGLALTNGSDRNVIERNNVSAGIGSPISIRDSDGNLVARNFGFAGGDAFFSHPLFVGRGSDNTTVVRNDLDGPSCCASGRAAHGIFVHAETHSTRLVRNEVRGYGGDGIHVESPATTLTRNSSNDNDGWGIFAVPRVIDGGHNTASGNLVGQCLNVIC